MTEPPEGGRANEGLLRLLATALGVPRSRLTLQQGAANRAKVVHLGAADPAAQLAALEGWLRSLG